MVNRGKIITSDILFLEQVSNMKETLINNKLSMHVAISLKENNSTSNHPNINKNKHTINFYRNHMHPHYKQDEKAFKNIVRRQYDPNKLSYIDLLFNIKFSEH